MGNRILSQEEIEVLLRGAQQDDDGSEVTEPDQEELLLHMEKDAIGEIANISMGTAATTLSQLLNKKVEITTPKAKLLSSKEVVVEFPQPSVMITVDYKQGIEGYNFFILSQQDCAVIVDLMMGGNGEVQSDELNDLQLSGIAEAMNQMMGSSATSMSSMFNTVVDITPPKVQITDLSTDTNILELLQNSEPLIRISFRLIVEGVIDSILAQVLPLRVAKGMVAKMLQNVQAVTQAPVQTPEQPPVEAQIQVNTDEVYKQNFYHEEPLKKEHHLTNIQPAQFGQLKPIKTAETIENLDLIMDVPLQVSVELGKAKKTIRDIMNLGPGAVIELDRIAGEPVDMVVNGKLIAKCEVVVINETFGIRITDIVHPSERLKSVN